MGVDYSHTRLFWTYTSHNRLCALLTETASLHPSDETPDPILNFTDADPSGDEIPWESCAATSARMRELLDMMPEKNVWAADAWEISRAIKVAGQLRQAFRIY